MSTNLNYKQVANVSRRTWDVETYEKKAKARQDETEGDDGATKRKQQVVGEGSQADDDNKEEFQRAEEGAAGPEGSKRAFLKARRSKVDIDSKAGTSEIVAADATAVVKSYDDGREGGVVKTGIGWHCKVCDCFLKDSHTYLDHINGRKHQRKLGYSMRVERSSKDQLKNKLQLLKKKKEEQSKQSELPEEEEANYADKVAAKDEEAQRRKEERRRKRQERKKRAQQAEEPEAEDEEEEEDEANDTEPQIDPAMAAMMGFSGFGGGNKNH